MATATPIERSVSKVKCSDYELGLKLIIHLSITKRSLYVKPRDLMKFFGLERNDKRLVAMGKSLRKLSELGLAVRHNNSRPIRYTLYPKELWLRFIDFELKQGIKFQCASDSTVCSLVDVCPMWKIRSEAK
ncbi:MAG: hypothetical protein N3G48_07670 [Sulfolobales archaeon]|nr:hypothetical protein [Sulfolobales archaeon]